MIDDDSHSMNLSTGGEPWVKYILKASLPNVKNASQAKKDIIEMLEPMMDSSNRSNVKRYEIPEYLRGYDIVWQKFFIYKRKGRYDPDLLVLKSSIREMYALELSRSIEMGQMSMIFQPKRIQDVFQRFMDDTKKKIGFFKTKQQDEGEM
jgi:hypothetical protein